MKGNDYFVQICRYPLTFGMFYTPGPSFVFSSVTRPCTMSPAPARAFSGLNSLKSMPLPCHAHWSKVWYFSLLTLFNFSATVLIRIAEVSRPVRPCVLCVRRRADPFVIFCFYDISSGVFLGCLPWFKPDLPVFIKFNADVIIAYFSSYFGQYRAVLKVNNVMPVLCALVKGCFILQGI